MLTPNHVQSVRRLQYWEDEFCPHGVDAMQPYFDNPDAVPLSANETKQLRSVLQDRFLRFVIYAPDRTIISSPTIFETSAKQSGRLLLRKVSPQRIYCPREQLDLRASVSA